MRGEKQTRGDKLRDVTRLGARKVLASGEHERKNEEPCDEHHAVCGDNKRR